MKKWNVLIQNRATGCISIATVTTEHKVTAMKLAEALCKGIARDAYENISSSKKKVEKLKYIG